MVGQWSYREDASLPLSITPRHASHIMQYPQLYALSYTYSLHPPLTHLLPSLQQQQAVNGAKVVSDVMGTETETAIPPESHKTEKADQERGVEKEKKSEKKMSAPKEAKETPG